MVNHQNLVPNRRARSSLKRCETHLSELLDEHVATISITDPTTLVALAQEAPLLAAREAQIAMRTLDSGFKEHRVGIIGAAYASAYYMLRTDRAWEKFIKDPGWDDLSNRPKDTMRARNRSLLHLLRYVFRAEGNKARRRVRVYAGMLQNRFDKGFKPEGVVGLINSRGIESLRAEGVAQRKAELGNTKASYLDELNAIGDEGPTPVSTLPKSQWRKLTPEQIGECLVMLNNFNGVMMRYLTNVAERATPQRSHDLTGAELGRSDDQPAKSAWRRR